MSVIKRPPFNLVACCSKKLSHAAPAKDLYCSQWFRLVRAVIEKRGEPWAILSAKHGLVFPDEVIEPYNETLHTKSPAELEQWANEVESRLYSRIPYTVIYSIWGGELYVDTLAPKLYARLPLRRLGRQRGIGEQMRELNRILAA
jgi:hypothetical protein